MSTGERIREARLAAGLSQKRLAKLAHCSERTIIRVENSVVDKPRAETLARIARVTGTTTDHLLGENDEEAAVARHEMMVHAFEAIRSLKRQLDAVDGLFTGEKRA